MNDIIAHYTRKQTDHFLAIDQRRNLLSALDRVGAQIAANADNDELLHALLLQREALEDRLLDLLNEHASQAT